MRALQGVGVLVTRPELQAAPLCDLLEAQGATAIRFAALSIRPVADAGAKMSRSDPLETFDVIVFTSANAVRFSAPWLGPPLRDFALGDSALRDPAQRDATLHDAAAPDAALRSHGHAPILAALGPATARALRQAGFPTAIVPVEGFDSEGLLLRPELRDIAGRRVLIVKGIGGREVLQEELARRGARVIAAAVYTRERTVHTPESLATLQASFAADAIQVITATSVEVAANLLESATPALRREFDRVHWLVPSARVAAALRDKGVAAPILQADSAEDHDLVAAIMRWRSSVSGA